MSILLNGKKIKVIDSHVHTFPDEIASKAVSKLAVLSGLVPYTSGTVSDTIEKLKYCKIDRAFALNIATSPKQQTTINLSAQKTNEQYGDIFEAFGSVHFLNKDAIAELDNIKKMGIKGIKLHPDYQDFMIDDKKLFPIYEKCIELDLPIIFHAGYDCYSPKLIHTPPYLAAKVAKTFPKLKMVLAHFGGLECWNDVGKYLVGENVYFDTAMCATYANQTQIENFIKNHDENKIMLGSDCPWENPTKSIEFITTMNLSDTIKEKILSQNALSLIR